MGQRMGWEGREADGGIRNQGSWTERKRLISSRFEPDGLMRGCHGRRMERAGEDCSNAKGQRKARRARERREAQSQSPSQSQRTQGKTCLTEGIFWLARPGPAH